MKVPAAVVWSLACIMISVSNSAAETPRGADKANNSFAFALMQRAGAARGNLTFSPVSIWTALAMTSVGAEGETLRQMRAVLDIPLKDESADRFTGGWIRKGDEIKGVTLLMANSLWGQRGYAFRGDFGKTLGAYGASMDVLEFARETEASRRHINRWVDERTNGKIKDLLEPGSITSDTELVLANAIYFLAKWHQPFEPHLTAPRSFTLASGEKADAPAMSGKFFTGYMEDDRLQAVRLHYEGGQAAMIVVLPRAADALDGKSFLDFRQYGSVFTALQEEKKVIVQLPKFEVSASLTLKRLLGELGMARAFSDDAEFGRMCDKPLKIANVFHKAWVKVAENGTEAAAATAVIMVPLMAAPAREKAPKVFIADHPFLFFIVDNRNGGILFAGRVMDPRK